MKIDLGGGVIEIELKIGFTARDARGTLWRVGPSMEGDPPGRFWLWPTENTVDGKFARAVEPTSLHEV